MTPKELIEALLDSNLTLAFEAIEGKLKEDVTLDEMETLLDEYYIARCTHEWFDNQ